MKYSPRNIISVFLILLLAILIFLFNSFFYTILIDPIARTFWLIVRTLFSIDQKILWGFLIILVSFVFFLFIPKDQEKNIPSPYYSLNKIGDCITVWKMNFQSADNGNARDLLRHNLEELAASMEDLLGKTDEEKFPVPMLKPQSQHIFWTKVTHLLERKSRNHSGFVDHELESDLTQFFDSMESSMER